MSRSFPRVSHTLVLLNIIIFLRLVTACIFTNGRIQLDEKFFHSNRMKIRKRYEDGSPIVNGISVNMIMKEERNVIIRFEIAMMMMMMHRVRNLDINEINF